MSVMQGRSGRSARAALAAAAVVGVALWLGRPGVSTGVLFPDSYAYRDWPNDFMLAGRTRVLGARPIGYALFLDVFGTGAALVWAQTLFSFAAWSALGWVVAGVAGTIGGCALALSSPLWRWNACVLSESTSLSLMALGLALALAWAERAARGERWSWRWPAAWCATVLLFGWSRDANLVLVPALLVPAFWLPARTRVLLVGVALVTLAVGAWDAARNDRADWALENAVLARVLPDAEAVERFRAAGMPVTAPVLAARGDPGSRTQRALREREPEFHAWVAQHGARPYWSWVLGKPIASVGAAAAAIEEHDGEDLPAYGAKLEVPWIVDAVRRASASMPPLPLVMFVPFLALVAFALERRLRPAMVAALLAVSTAAMYCFLAYHADAVEVYRHMLLGLVLLRVSFWVAVIAVAAVAEDWRRARLEAVQ